MARTWGGGATDCVTVPHYTAIDSLTDLSLAAWCFMTGGGGSSLGRIAQKTPVAGQGWSCYNNGVSTKTNFDANRWGTTAGQWQSTQCATNAWTHILWTYSFSSTSNNAIMYFNGVAQTTTRVTAPAGTLGTDTNDLAIGNNVGGGTGNRNFAGRLMHVCLWNRILSAGEVTGVYKNGPMRHSSGLVLWLPLFGVASPEPNYAGAGGTATVTGTTTGAANAPVTSPFWHGAW